MPIGYRLQPLHVANATIELSREDRFGSLRNCGFNSNWIDQVVRTALHSNRSRSSEVDGSRSGHHRMGAEDDFVPWLYARTNRCNDQRIRSVSDAQRIASSRIHCEIRLKFLEVLLIDKRSPAAYVGKDRHKLGFVRLEDVGVVEKWNGTKFKRGHCY